MCHIFLHIQNLIQVYDGQAISICKGLQTLGESLIGEAEQINYVPEKNSHM